MRRLGAILLATAAAGAVLAAPAVAAPPPNTNSEAYWESVLGMEDCTKIEYGYPVGQDGWTADGDYGAVIVKGGSVATPPFNAPGVVVYQPVTEGQLIMPPLNAGGQQAAISWIMTCDPGDGYSS